MRDRIEAVKNAQQKRNEFANRISSPTGEEGMTHHETLDPGSKAFNALFALQRRVEDGGAMSYRTYAQNFLKKITNEEPDILRADFRSFEGSLIARLHDIRNPVYDHVVDVIPQLIEQYGDRIARLSLWSQGDVESTGYQDGKIASTGIATHFMRSLLSQMTKDAGRQFLEEKVRYGVADRKIPELGAYTKDAMEHGPVKLVIIEDSYGNFEKVRNAIVAAMGEEKAKSVIVRNIWALYSREGQNAKAEAEKGMTAKNKFVSQSRSVTPIESFAELLDKEKFGRFFQDAHVFVDFDGVIGDNVEMRNLQANAIVSAAVDGFSQHWNIDRKEALQRIIDRLEKKG